MRSAAGEYVRAFPGREIRISSRYPAASGVANENNSQFCPRILRCLTQLDAQVYELLHGSSSSPERVSSQPLPVVRPDGQDH